MLKNNLKSWRHKYEMNQKEFAEFLGVNYSLYNRWEKQHGSPNRESLLKITQILKCQINDIIEKIPEK